MEKALKKPDRKAVFYGRYSTDDQDISTQRMQCQMFAAKYNMEIIDEYLDTNKSAFKTQLKTRKSLMKLLEDAEKGTFDTVLVYKSDRLARNPEQHIRLWASFRDLKVDVFDVSRPVLYTTTDFQQLILDFGMSSFEAENISVRTRDYYNTHTSEGRWLGGILPYGYRYEFNPEENEEKPKKLIVQIPEKIIKIREIFDFYIKGYGFQAIAENMKAKYPGDCWKKEKIKPIITNPFYAGFTTSKRYKKQSGNSLNPRKDWVVGKCNRIPLAIEEETWNACMELYEQKLAEGHDSKRLTTPFLFRDILYCTKCQKKLQTKNYTSGKKKKQGGRYEYRRYICPVCRQKWDQHEVDKRLSINTLSNWHLKMYGNNQQEVFEEEVIKSVNADLNQLDNEIKSLQKELNRWEQQQLEAKKKLDELMLSTEEQDREMQKVMVQLRISIQKKKNNLHELIERKQKEQELIRKEFENKDTWLKKGLRFTSFFYKSSSPHFRNLVLFVFQRITIDENMNFGYVARVNMEDYFDEEENYEDDEGFSYSYSDFYED